MKNDKFMAALMPAATVGLLLIYALERRQTIKLTAELEKLRESYYQQLRSSY